MPSRCTMSPTLTSICLKCLELSMVWNFFPSFSPRLCLFGYLPGPDAITFPLIGFPCHTVSMTPLNLGAIGLMIITSRNGLIRSWGAIKAIGVWDRLVLLKTVPWASEKLLAHDRSAPSVWSRETYSRTQRVFRSCVSLRIFRLLAIGILSRTYGT